MDRASVKTGRLRSLWPDGGDKAGERENVLIEDFLAQCVAVIGLVGNQAQRKLVDQRAWMVGSTNFTSASEAASVGPSGWRQKTHERRQLQ